LELISKKKPKKILKTSVPMQNKNPFQIKILRKKKSKIFQTHPITINLLLVSILFAESFEI
jgi:hypothetical protein